MPPLNRLRTLGGLRGRALSGSSDPIGNAIRAALVDGWELGAKDSYSGTRTLTKNGTVTRVAGQVGYASQVAITGYLSRADSGSDLDITTTDFGISIWSSGTVAPTTIVSKGGSTPAWEFDYIATGGRVDFYLHDGTGAVTVSTSGVNCQTGAMNHLLVNGDRDGNLDIYVNGVLRGQGSIAARQASLANAGAFNVGAWDGGLYGITGKVNQLLFRRSLWSADEIAYLYNSGAGRSLWTPETPYPLLSVYGDSIAKGMGVHGVTMVYNQDPYALYETAYNKAASGALVADAATQFAGDTPQANVLIGVGINDIVGGSSAATVWAALESLIDDVLAAGKTCRVATIAPWKNGAGWTSGKQTITASVNASILAKAGITPINVYAALDDGTGALAAAYDFGDGFHPNQAGHEVMRAVLEATF